ncbi:MAG TPA: hypothetical protein VFD80_07690 [Flavobacteriaceae bacterium]|nr:hypothetical protein [Flavobacteriaceae bacterium]
MKRIAILSILMCFASSTVVFAQENENVKAETTTIKTKIKSEKDDKTVTENVIIEKTKSEKNKIQVESNQAVNQRSREVNTEEKTKTKVKRDSDE